MNIKSTMNRPAATQLKASCLRRLWKSSARPIQSPKNSPNSEVARLLDHHGLDLDHSAEIPEGKQLAQQGQAHGYAQAGPDGQLAPQRQQQGDAQHDPAVEVEDLDEVGKLPVQQHVDDHVRRAGLEGLDQNEHLVPEDDQQRAPPEVLGGGLHPVDDHEQRGTDLGQSVHGPDAPVGHVAEVQEPLDRVALDHQVDGDAAGDVDAGDALGARLGHPPHLGGIDGHLQGRLPGHARALLPGRR
jgi:hypothetical protein